MADRLRLHEGVGADAAVQVLLRPDAQHVPESQVWPARSHAAFVVYEPGEALGDEDSCRAHPAINPTSTRATATVFIDCPPLEKDQASLAPALTMGLVEGPRRDGAFPLA